MEFHADKHSYSPKSVWDGATLQFKQASEAYKVLMDDRKRADYNFDTLFWHRFLIGKWHDLYVLLSSFLHKGGQILSVVVYPSEFGLKRMEEEAVRGPIGLFDDEEEQNENDDDDEIDNEKLCAYELSRLRYYYAVVECDSITTANYLYKTSDGVEFERSSNKLD